MDADRLGFPSQVFDVVTSGFAVDSFLDTEHALGEMYRVLRSGGRLGLSAAPGWWWQNDPGWQWHEDLLSELDVWVESSRLVERDLWENALRDTGFVGTEIREENYGLRWSDPDEW
jgi:SAM-dependent methyltransferase